MQKRVGKRCLVPKVRGLAKQSLQRMSGRQRLERIDEIPDLDTGGADTDPFAEFLQHVDARPSIRRVHHDVHRSVGLEQVAQRA